MRSQDFLKSVNGTPPGANAGVFRSGSGDEGAVSSDEEEADLKVINVPPEFRPILECAWYLPCRPATSQLPMARPTPRTHPSTVVNPPPTHTHTHRPPLQPGHPG